MTRSTKKRKAAKTLIVQEKAYRKKSKSSKGDSGSTLDDESEYECESDDDDDKLDFCQ